MSESEKEDNKVYLCFGYSKDSYLEVMAVYYKKRGNAVLPIRWMPPEAYFDGIFSFKTDVWSFGVLLWEVMSLGYIPYSDCTNREVMSLVSSGGRLEPPSNCPSPLYAIMTSCWCINPEDRPNFETILEKLESCIQDPHVIGSDLSVGNDHILSEQEIIVERPPNEDCNNSSSLLPNDDVIHLNDSTSSPNSQANKNHIKSNYAILSHCSSSDEDDVQPCDSTPSNKNDIQLNYAFMPSGSLPNDDGIQLNDYVSPSNSHSNKNHVQLNYAILSPGSSSDEYDAQLRESTPSTNLPPNEDRTELHCSILSPRVLPNEVKIQSDDSISSTAPFSSNKDGIQQNNSRLKSCFLQPSKEDCTQLNYAILAPGSLTDDDGIQLQDSIKSSSLPSEEDQRHLNDAMLSSRQFSTEDCTKLVDVIPSLDTPSGEDCTQPNDSTNFPGSSTDENHIESNCTILPPGSPSKKDFIQPDKSIPFSSPHANEDCM